MQYFSLKEYGGPENLQLENKKLNDPLDHEIQIQQTYIGINRTDVLYRMGVYPSQLPEIIGTTAVGYVINMGRGVKSYQIGDRVVYASGALGAYAEARNIDHNLVFNINTVQEDYVIASYFDKIFAAFHLMRRTFMVLENDYILINGAAGAVGHIMCQLGSHFKANVIALVSSEKSAEFAKKNKAKHILINAENLEEKIMTLTNGRGVKVVYDFLGGNDAKKLYKMLGFFGTIVHVGDVLGVPPDIPVNNLSERAIFITRPDLNIYKRNRYEFLLTANEVFEILDKQIILPQNIFEYNFKDIPSVHYDIEARKYHGCLVAKV